MKHDKSQLKKSMNLFFNWIKSLSHPNHEDFKSVLIAIDDSDLGRT